MGVGKGGGQASAAAGMQADFAKQLFQQSGPLRDLLFGTPGTAGTAAVAASPGRFIPGGDSEGYQFPDIAARPAVPGIPGTPGLVQGLLTQPSGIFPAERDMLESQFSRAREGIISGGPGRGGLQASLLAQNEAERAFGLTGLASQGQQRQIENIFRTGGLVTGQNQLSLGGLGSAAGTFSGLAGQQAALAGQLGQAAGLTAGLGMAGKTGAGAGAGKGAAAAAPLVAACWIAKAIYGQHSVEAALARLWIFRLWSGPLASACRWLYRLTGRRVARSRLLCLTLRPLFDLAVARAERAR